MFDCGFDPATSGTEMQSTDNRKKKTDKKYHGSIVNGLDQGKKSVQETEGASIWQFPKTNLSSGDEQRYQEHTQGSIPRLDTSEHTFFLSRSQVLKVPQDLRSGLIDFFSTERANEGSIPRSDK